MKLKYYLRGMGIGIIVTTIILTISFSQREVEISDAEVIARASELGMVMQDEVEPEQIETAETETQQMDTNETQADEGQTTTDVLATEQVPTVNDMAATEQTPTAEEAVVTEDVPTDLTGEETTVADGTSTQEGSFLLVIKKGDVCRTVCENLATNGIISDAEAFRTYLFEIGYANNMSVGEYEIPYGLSYEEVAEILQAGPIEKQ